MAQILEILSKPGAPQRVANPPRVSAESKPYGWKRRLYSDNLEGASATTLDRIIEGHTDDQVIEGAQEAKKAA